MNIEGLPMSAERTTRRSLIRANRHPREASKEEAARSEATVRALLQPGPLAASNGRGRTCGKCRAQREAEPGAVSGGTPPSPAPTVDRSGAKQRPMIHESGPDLALVRLSRLELISGSSADQGLGQ
jgi:hypothetical protein